MDRYSFSYDVNCDTRGRCKITVKSYFKVPRRCVLRRKNHLLRLLNPRGVSFRPFRFIRERFIQFPSESSYLENPNFSFRALFPYTHTQSCAHILFIKSWAMLAWHSVLSRRNGSNLGGVLNIFCVRRFNRGNDPRESSIVPSFKLFIIILCLFLIT